MAKESRKLKDIMQIHKSIKDSPTGLYLVQSSFEEPTNSILQDNT